MEQENSKKNLSFHPSLNKDMQGQQSFKSVASGGIHINQNSLNLFDNSSSCNENKLQKLIVTPASTADFLTSNRFKNVNDIEESINRNRFNIQSEKQNDITNFQDKSHNLIKHFQTRNTELTHSYLLQNKLQQQQSHTDEPFFSFHQNKSGSFSQNQISDILRQNDTEINNYEKNQSNYLNQIHLENQQYLNKSNYDNIAILNQQQQDNQNIMSFQTDIDKVLLKEQIQAFSNDQLCKNYDQSSFDKKQYASLPHTSASFQSMPFKSEFAKRFLKTDQFSQQISNINKTSISLDSNNQENIFRRIYFKDSKPQQSLLVNEIKDQSNQNDIQTKIQKLQQKYLQKQNEYNQDKTIKENNSECKNEMNNIIKSEERVLSHAVQSLSNSFNNENQIFLKNRNNSINHSASPAFIQQPLKDKIVSKKRKIVNKTAKISLVQLQKQFFMKKLEDIMKPTDDTKQQISKTFENHENIYKQDIQQNTQDFLINKNSCKEYDNDGSQKEKESLKNYSEQNNSIKTEFSQNNKQKIQIQNQQNSNEQNTQNEKISQKAHSQTRNSISHQLSTRNSRQYQDLSINECKPLIKKTKRSAKNDSSKITGRSLISQNFVEPQSEESESQKSDKKEISEINIENKKMNFQVNNQEYSQTKIIQEHDLNKSDYQNNSSISNNVSLQAQTNDMPVLFSELTTHRNFLILDSIQQIKSPLQNNLQETFHNQNEKIIAKELFYSQDNTQIEESEDNYAQNHYQKIIQENEMLLKYRSKSEIKHEENLQTKQIINQQKWNLEQCQAKLNQYQNEILNLKNENHQLSQQIFRQGEIKNLIRKYESRILLAEDNLRNETNINEKQRAEIAVLQQNAINNFQDLKIKFKNFSFKDKDQKFKLNYQKDGFAIIIQQQIFIEQLENEILYLNDRLLKMDENCQQIIDQLQPNKKYCFNQENERIKQLEDNLLECENKNVLQLNDIQILQELLQEKNEKNQQLNQQVSDLQNSLENKNKIIGLFQNEKMLENEKNSALNESQVKEKEIQLQNLKNDNLFLSQQLLLKEQDFQKLLCTNDQLQEEIQKLSALFNSKIKEQNQQIIIQQQKIQNLNIQKIKLEEEIKANNQNFENQIKQFQNQKVFIEFSQQHTQIKNDKLQKQIDKQKIQKRQFFERVDHILEIYEYQKSSDNICFQEIEKILQYLLTKKVEKKEIQQQKQENELSQMQDMNIYIQDQRSEELKKKIQKLSETIKYFSNSIKQIKDVENKFNMLFKYTQSQQYLESELISKRDETKILDIIEECFNYSFQSIFQMILYIEQQENQNTFSKNSLNNEFKKEIERSSQKLQKQSSQNSKNHSSIDLNDSINHQISFNQSQNLQKFQDYSQQISQSKFYQTESINFKELYIQNEIQISQKLISSDKKNDSKMMQKTQETYKNREIQNIKEFFNINKEQLSITQQNQEQIDDIFKLIDISKNIINNNNQRNQDLKEWIKKND